jgi:type III secretory pathway lipoprotein EscJ
MRTGPMLAILLATLVLAGCNVTANNQAAIRQANEAIAQDAYGPSD